MTSLLYVRNIFIIISLITIFIGIYNLMNVPMTGMTMLRDMTMDTGSSERFLVGRLVTVRDRGPGLGNNIFELISFIGIADVLKRTPLLNHSCYQHFQRWHGEFTHMLSALRPYQKTFPNTTFFENRCCFYRDPLNDTTINNSNEYAFLNLKFAQSYKFFETLGRERVMDLMTMSDEVMEKARTSVVSEDLLNVADHVICVHTRRGDFVSYAQAAPSTAQFTEAAVQFIFNRVSKKFKKKAPLMVLIGQDRKFLEELFDNGKKFPVTIANSSKKMPALDWAFSRQFCDSYVMTAGASTFGWWGAYLSRGQDIYYNSVVSKGGGLGKIFNPDDFFPPEWNPLEFELSTGKVALRPPYL